jgi:hypothetical protein
LATLSPSDGERDGVRGRLQGEGHAAALGANKIYGSALERKAVAARTEEVGVTIARSIRRREELLQGMGATVFMT